MTEHRPSGVPSRELQRDVLESLNRAVVETALDAVVMIDHTGPIIEFNPAAESIFGRKLDEVLGESMQQLLVSEHLRDGDARGMVRYLQDRESQILGRRLRLVGLREARGLQASDPEVRDFHTPVGQESERGRMFDGLISR